MLAKTIRAWFENRLARSDHTTLTQRNLYILPTRAGWAFCITLVVMLLAAINYQINLGYALTFLLGGAALVSMQQTHNNLRGLALRIKPPAPVFAGEACTLEIVFDNPGAERHGVGLGLYDAQRQALSFCDVPALGSASARLRFTPMARGLHALPTLRIESHFPLGLFRAWTVWRPAAQVMVYPKPELAAPALPPAQSSADGPQPDRLGAGGEFQGVRAWRNSDTLRQVVWKKSARAGELISRDTSASATLALTLDFAGAGSGTGPGTNEARLSRLTAWVLIADRLGHGYALRLPGTALPSASGDGQRRAALAALALWRAPSAGESA